jgi:hypothetical protein
MRNSGFYLLGLVPAAFGIACGGEDDHAGAARECETLCQDVATRCPGAVTVADCEEAFCPLVAPAGCHEALSKSSCADAETGASWLDICLPPCSAPTAQCNGNTSITQCVDAGGQLRSATLLCEAICEQKDGTYSGTCSATYGSQASSTGLPVCWCRQG